MKRTRHAPETARPTLRARIAAAFGKIAGAVNERMAHRKTTEFYRSSGAPWTRGLN